MVWIPPLDGDDDIIQEIDDESDPFYEEIPPKRNLTESNVADKVKLFEEIKNKPLTTMCKNEKNSKISKMLVAQSLGECNSMDAASKASCAGRSFKSPNSDAIQMKDFGNADAPVPNRVDRRSSCTSLCQEKETAEVKRDFYELDDIQFADDEDETVQNCDTTCIEENSKIAKLKNTNVTVLRR